MDEFPDTRESLILKIADARNAVAWEEFAQIYRPVVYRLARQRGFQHADAEEVGQEAMVAVARAVENWVPDPQLGRFRDWLFRISRNLMINFLTRRRHQVWGTADTDMHRLLEEQADPDAATSSVFDEEYRNSVFQVAAGRVRSSVAEKTWRAFWSSTIDDRPVAEVAQQLQMSVGSVYIARSRVMARLRKEVQQLDGSQELNKLSHPTAGTVRSVRSDKKPPEPRA